MFTVRVFRDTHRPGKVFAEVEDWGSIGVFWTIPCDTPREAIEVAQSEYEIRKRGWEVSNSQ